MAKVIHKIDPNADTVIILKDPLVHFAVWNYPNVEELDAEESAPCERSHSVESAQYEVVEEEVTEEVPAPTEDAPTEDAPTEDAPTEDAPTEDAPTEDAPTEDAPLVEESVVEPDAREISSQEEEIQYHVSSSHLRLASPNFERMLSRGNWMEGMHNKDDGRYYISTKDWDGEAFLILLNALHLRSRQVPRSVSLEMLAKIAVLVDYYNCAEAVELSTEMWVEQLKNTTPIPSKYCRDLVLWMCIAWVLRLPQEFTQATAIAINESKQGDLSPLGLPMTGFTDSIDQVRNQAIDTILSQLHNLLDEYRNPNYCCPNGGYSFECGSILYGALTKEMESLGLLSVPYSATLPPGMSLSEIYLKVRKMKSPMWCTSPGRSKSSWAHPYTHRCNLSEKVSEITNRVMGGINGLKLEDFGRT